MAALIRPLTPAQSRVAALVKHGYSYVRIARTLNLSRHTVRTHIRTIATMLDHYDPDVSYYNAVLLWASHAQLDAAA